MYVSSLFFSSIPSTLRIYTWRSDTVCSRRVSDTLPSFYLYDAPITVPSVGHCSQLLCTRWIVGGDGCYCRYLYSRSKKMFSLLTALTRSRFISRTLACGTLPFSWESPMSVLTAVHKLHFLVASCCHLSVCTALVKGDMAALDVVNETKTSFDVFSTDIERKRKKPEKTEKSSYNV